MATLDVRSTHDNIDTLIVYDDNEGEYSITHMVKHGFGRKGSPAFVFDLDNECAVVSKEHAENIIKALQYAIKEGWWNE